MNIDNTTTHDKTSEEIKLSENIISCIYKLHEKHSPLCAYIYDLDSLNTRIQYIKDHLPKNVQLFYAIKANSEPEVLSTLADTVDGFEAASGGELEWLKNHQPDMPIIFGGPGKLKSDLYTAIDQQIDTIHVESLVELERIIAITHNLRKPANIFLRMNIDIGDIGTSKLAMGGKPTPFGLDESYLTQALTMINSTSLINLKGFHFHLMSHQLDVQRHISLIEHYIRKVIQWQKEYSLSSNMMINVGGGMGIDYSNQPKHFNWKLFCNHLKSILSKSPTLILRFEIGRFISAPCGYYVMQVIDIKKNLGENFVIGHGGTHHFRTPAAQQHDHPFFILKKNSDFMPHSKSINVSTSIEMESNINNAYATVVGQLCTPKDILARRQWIKSLEIGDFIVFTLAGAYSWNISHQNFLMHQPPQKIFLK